MKLHDHMNNPANDGERNIRRIWKSVSAFDLNKRIAWDEDENYCKSNFDLRESEFKQVEEAIDGRNEKYHKLCARGHWRPAEDAMLKELVDQFGPQSWNLIAEHLPARSGKSCRLRWFNQLDPKINKRPFSDEEEEKLLRSHKLYGNKWAMIAKLFPGRTDNAVKNHWHVIMARKQREHYLCAYKKMKLNPITATSNPAVVVGAKNFVAFSDDSNVTTASDTCVELTLSPTSVLANPCLFAKSALPNSPMGVSKEGLVHNAIDLNDQRSEFSCKSGSDSHGSALESVACSKVDKDELKVFGSELETIINKKNTLKEMPLIDFLGLGYA